MIITFHPATARGRHRMFAARRLERLTRFAYTRGP
jgi:hypothetical protein